MKINLNSVLQKSKVTYPVFAEETEIDPKNIKACLYCGDRVLFAYIKYSIEEDAISITQPWWIDPSPSYGNDADKYTAILEFLFTRSRDLKKGGHVKLVSTSCSQNYFPLYAGFLFLKPIEQTLTKIDSKLCEEAEDLYQKYLKLMGSADKSNQANNPNPDFNLELNNIKNTLMNLGREKLDGKSLYEYGLTQAAHYKAEQLSCSALVKQCTNDTACQEYISQLTPTNDEETLLAQCLKINFPCTPTIPDRSSFTRYKNLYQLMLETYSNMIKDTLSLDDLFEDGLHYNCNDFTNQEYRLHKAHPGYSINPIRRFENKIMYLPESVLAALSVKYKPSEKNQSQLLNNNISPNLKTPEPIHTTKPTYPQNNIEQGITIQINGEELVPEIPSIPKIPSVTKIISVPRLSLDFINNQGNNHSLQENEKDQEQKTKKYLHKTETPQNRVPENPQNHNAPDTILKNKPAAPEIPSVPTLLQDSKKTPKNNNSPKEIITSLSKGQVPPPTNQNDLKPEVKNNPEKEEIPPNKELQSLLEELKNEYYKATTPMADKLDIPEERELNAKRAMGALIRSKIIILNNQEIALLYGYLGKLDYLKIINKVRTDWYFRLANTVRELMRQTFLFSFFRPAHVCTEWKDTYLAMLEQSIKNCGGINILLEQLVKSPLVTENKVLAEYLDLPTLPKLVSVGISPEPTASQVSQVRCQN